MIIAKKGLFLVNKKEIKIRLFKLDKKIKDLAWAAGYDYNYFCQIIGNFKKTPKNFNSDLERVFGEWENRVVNVELAKRSRRAFKKHGLH